MSMIKEITFKAKSKIQEWKSLLSGDFQPNMDTTAQKFDPVKHCGVYNTIGCSHVDGLLCSDRCELMAEYEEQQFYKHNNSKPCGNCDKCKCDKPAVDQVA